MLSSLFLAGLVVAGPSSPADALNKIALPPRRNFVRSTGEVNGPALLESLQQTLNKYNLKSSLHRTSPNPTLLRRVVTEDLTDQVQPPDFDEEYYGPIEVGSGTSQQTFTVQFDTGSSDILVPGPLCTSDEGCPYYSKYNEGGISQGQTASVQYGSGYVEGDIYTDSISVAGLTATNQGLISLTQATGFNSSASDGLLGMGFTSLSSSGYTAFFENLIAQNQVASPEFSFYLGRSATNTAHLSSLCLGCRDPTLYRGASTSTPVTDPAYWQVVLNAITVSGVSAGPTTRGQAIIDTGTTLVLAPTAASSAIFDLVPDSFPIAFSSSSSDDDGAGSSQTFYAYPCTTDQSSIPAIRFGGRAFAINALDFNFGVLTPSFARLVGNENLAARLESKSGGEKQQQKQQTERMKKNNNKKRQDEGNNNDGGGGIDLEEEDGEDYCVAALVGTDDSPRGNLFVVGDAFLKNWYTTFNYAGAGGRPSVSFAQAV